MKKRLLVLVTLLAVAGCKASPHTRISWEPSRGDDRTVIGWRLTERTYGEINDVWTAAGDGEIPSDESALVFEPVYGEPPPSDPYEDPEPGPGPCLHDLRVAYEGAGNEGIGNRAVKQFWFTGFGDEDHVVAITSSHKGVEILDVEGAIPVPGSPGRYVLEANVRGAVGFTSRVVGYGDVRIRVIGEMSRSGGTVVVLARR